MASLLLKLPDDMLATWRQSAAAAGMNLSEWIRSRVNGVGVTLGTPTPVRATTLERDPICHPAATYTRPEHNPRCTCLRCKPHK